MIFKSKKTKTDPQITMNYDILQDVSDGVYIIDTKRKILFWNKAAEQITGYKAGEITGLNCQDDLLKHVNDDGCCLCQKDCPLASCMSDGTPKQIQAYLSHKDGYRVPVSIRASPMLGANGEVIGSVEIFQKDIYRTSMLDRLSALKKQGLIDPLTGLANQEYFQTVLQNKIDDLQNRTQYFGIILADVDNYRNFVEYHGQALGEQIIQSVAQTLAINCDVDDKKVVKLINKPLNIFSNTKIRLDFVISKNTRCKSVNIEDRKLYQNYLVKIDQINSFHIIDKFESNGKKNYLKFFKKKNNDLYLINDIVKISENLLIPDGMNVIINSGQKLILLNNSFIISNSPWIVNGKKKEIIISGLVNDVGGGILIKNSLRKSYFNNVKFAYLSGMPQNNEFIISGAINFYKTNVLMKNVIFEKTSSEDAMNVVNSKFDIKNIKFSQSKSDSLDLDFSKGSIYDAKFIDIGNDAIDFSGSNVDISNIYFDTVGDKLISVGENSNINISNINAQKSLVGIASKDGSVVRASSIIMKNVQLPFLSFNKKFEYEPATMHLSEINIKNFKEKWLTDKKSKIYHNKSKVGKISKNIIPIVYEKNMELLKKIN